MVARHFSLGRSRDARTVSITRLVAGFDRRQRAPALLVALPSCLELTPSARGRPGVDPPPVLFGADLAEVPGYGE